MNNNLYYKKKIFSLLENINGKTLYYLINIFNYKLNIYFYKDKGWIGKFIEFLILSNFSNKKNCDIKKLSLEIKTLSLNLLGDPIQDVFLISYKLYNFLNNILNIKEFLDKNSKILWIPIIESKNKNFFSKVIGKYFISIFDNRDIKLFIDDFNYINNFILNNNINFTNLYSRFFRFQFFYNKNYYINNNFINFTNFYIKIYFRKKYIKKIINNCVLF